MTDEEQGPRESAPATSGAAGEVTEAEGRVRPGAAHADAGAAGHGRETGDRTDEVRSGRTTRRGRAGRDRGGDDVGKKDDRDGRSMSFWIELPILVAIALVLALVVKTWVVQAFYIPSGSMENTLEVGDRVLVNKLVYHFRDIHRGDIVVFNGMNSWDTEASIIPPANPVGRFVHSVAAAFGAAPGEKDYIKRVIGIPGDHVHCCDSLGRVTVNGVPLNEKSYLYPGNSPSDRPFDVTVPPGRLWVMGDHRAVSSDSRMHIGEPGGGTIPENKVLGRAFVVVWPPSQVKILPIPATFQQAALSASGPLLPAAPVALGFVGAVPLTWAQRRVRRRWRARRLCGG